LALDRVGGSVVSRQAVVMLNISMLSP
jgi:hypothetical protein